jgi:hypothetical protein
MLKSNGPNSISKDALRDEDYPWLINCTTQEYLVNVGQDSHFNTYQGKMHNKLTIRIELKKHKKKKIPLKSIIYSDKLSIKQRVKFIKLF